MYVFLLIIVVKQVSRVSKCVYLAPMALKLEHTVGGQNYESLRNASPMFMWAEKRVLTTVKIEIVHQNLLNDMET